MGIRYLAVAFRNDDVETAHEWKRVQDEANRLHDIWARDFTEDDEDILDADGDRRSSYDLKTLDLDKSWRDLQHLLHGTDAAALVRGNVTHTGGGWISHFAVLTAPEVAAAATALAGLDEATVKEAVRAHAFSPDRAEQDAEYVWEYVQRAAEFTARLARQGRALAAWIG